MAVRSTELNTLCILNSDSNYVNYAHFTDG